MLGHVVGEGHIGIQGGIHPALEHHGQGLVQGGHAGDGGTVLLSQGHVSGGDGVGSGLALQVLKGLDILVVAADNQRGADVGIGIGEVILFAAVGGDLHAVDHDVIPAGIHTREQAVPLTGDNFRLHAQFGGNGLRHLHIEAHQCVALAHKGPGCPVALQADDDGTPFLDLGQKIGRRGSFAAGGQQGGQQQNRQHQRHDLFHFILLLFVL